MQDNADVKAMLAEVQNKLDRQNESAAVLKNHAQTILSAISIIVTFFAALSTTRVPPQNALLFLHLEEVIGGVYVLMIGACIYALLPYAVEGPIRADLATYQAAFLGKDEREVTKALIVQYLEAIRLNEARIKTRQKASVAISVLMPVIVILIIWASLLPVMTR